MLSGRKLPLSDEKYDDVVELTLSRGGCPGFRELVKGKGLSLPPEPETDVVMLDFLNGFTKSRFSWLWVDGELLPMLPLFALTTGEAADGEGESGRGGGEGGEGEYVDCDALFS